MFVCFFIISPHTKKLHEKKKEKKYTSVQDQRLKEKKKKQKLSDCIKNIHVYEFARPYERYYSLITIMCGLSVTVLRLLFFCQGQYT